MKRLMIATVLVLATSSLSVWAQTAASDADKPQAAKPAQAMPMADCAGSSAAMRAVQGCPMASGEQSDQGTMPMHQIMHGGMMHGAQHPGGQGCCELSKADKPK